MGEDMEEDGIGPSLFAQLCSFENLLRAYRKAARGKRSQVNVATFEYHLEGWLLRLRDQLRAQRYRPGAYRRFTISDPKPRYISAAPFADRVVHHALCLPARPSSPLRSVMSYACLASWPAKYKKGAFRATGCVVYHACRVVGGAPLSSILSLFQAIEGAALVAKLIILNESCSKPCLYVDLSILSRRDGESDVMRGGARCLRAR